MYHVNSGFHIPPFGEDAKKSATAPKLAAKKPAAKPAVKKLAAKPAAKPDVKTAAKPAAKTASTLAAKKPATATNITKKVKCKIPVPASFEKPLIKADNLPDKDLNHVFTYAGSSYKTFNQRLASKSSLTPTQMEMHKSLHRASSRIATATILHRGIKVPATEMPNEWIEERWASSSLKLQTAKGFSGGKCLMELHVDPEVRVVATCHILGRKGSSYCESEQEITIAPGAHYQVISRTDTTLKVKVTPGEQAKRKADVLYKNAKAA